MSACPIKETTINFIKTNKNVLTYKRNISISLFIVSYFLLTYIASHCLKISNLPLLIFSLLNAFFSFYISFIIYEKSIQNIFSSISLSNKKRMPKYSFFNLLYDIIIRKSTLLRDMDIERMKKFGNIYLMFMGYRPAIVITSSDLAKKVSKKIDIYAKSNPIDLNMPYFYKWVGNNNIVLSNGSDWKRLRNV